MRILFISPDFYPNIGGVEQIVLGLATILSRRAVEITILTRTQFSGKEPNGLNVIRNFSTFNIYKTIQNFELVVIFNLSLKKFLPFIFNSKPLIIVHGGKYSGWSAPLKKWISYFWASEQVSCSHFVANSLKSTKVIPNFYLDNIFFNYGLKKDRLFDIAFLGRLVPEKGCEILLRSIHLLSKSETLPNVLIVGSGPEEFNLKKLCVDLELNNQVKFVGNKVDKELADTLNQCKTLVIPSIVEEGFGIVALEGIACGCMVIGSERGGLVESIGPCGLTFPNGDVNALAESIKKVILNPEISSDCQKYAQEHLKKHTQEFIAAQYLQVLEDVYTKSNS